MGFEAAAASTVIGKRWKGKGRGRKRERKVPTPPPFQNKKTKPINQSDKQKKQASPHLQSGLAWQPDWKSRAEHRGPPTKNYSWLFHSTLKKKKKRGEETSRKCKWGLSCNKAQQATISEQQGFRSLSGNAVWQDKFTAVHITVAHKGPGGSHLGLPVHMLHHRYSCGSWLAIIIDNIYIAHFNWRSQVRDDPSTFRYAQPPPTTCWGTASLHCHAEEMGQITTRHSNSAAAQNGKLKGWNLNMNLGFEKEHGFSP